VIKEFKFNQTYYTSLEIDPKSKKIEFSLIGKPISKSTLEAIQKKLIKNALEATSLVVHQAEKQKIDTLSLKTNIVADLYKESQIAVDSRGKQIVKLNEQLHSYKTTEELMESETPEFHILFPEINSIVIPNGISSTSSYDVYHQKVTLLLVDAKKRLSAQNAERLTTWMGKRLKKI
jgi:hypothetical protein